MYENKVAIVTLSRYPDLFVGLEGNLNKFAPSFDRVLVKDGYLLPETALGWLNVQGPEGKFSYSVNANLGIKAVDPEADILLIGDDVRLQEDRTIERLVDQAYSDNNVGMLSPRIIGGADNELQMFPTHDVALSYSSRYLALVCTYIKRVVVDSVGLLDEVFSTGWGWDDVDYSRRVRKAGFSLAITPIVSVVHGVNRRGSETLIRNEKGDNKAIQAQDDINAKAYLQKWGDNIK